MPISTGFDHVATLTTDMDLTVGFYEAVFEGVVTFEVARTDDHPWMKIGRALRSLPCRQLKSPLI